jgi:WD40 repeat protein
MAVISRSSRLILVQLETTRTQLTQEQSPSSIHTARALGRGAEELGDGLDSSVSSSLPLSAVSDLPLGGFHLCQVRCKLFSSPITSPLISFLFFSSLSFLLFPVPLPSFPSSFFALLRSNCLILFSSRLSFLSSLISSSPPFSLTSHSLFFITLKVLAADIARERPVLATVSADATARRWNYDSQKCEIVHRFTGDEPLSIAIHSSGKGIFLACMTGGYFIFFSSLFFSL